MGTGWLRAGRRRIARARISDNLVPGWLVVQVFGTVLLIATLLTAHPKQPWLWAVYGASLGCWLVFVAVEARLPRLGLAALALCTALPGLTVWTSDGSTALIIMIISLGRFASLTAPGTGLIIAVTATDMVLVVLGELLWHRSAVDGIGDAAALLLIALLGLNRRQYQLRARQAEQLLEQVRLAQHEHARAAALDERTRIAREMHDVLAHSLGALGVQLDVAEALLADKGDVDRALERVRRSRRLAAEGLDEARRAVAALRTGVPALPDALAELADNHRRDHEVAVQVRIDGGPRPVSSAATVSLLGTAREALTNAARHAPGAAVEIRLDYRDRAVRLQVCNEPGPNGAGPGPGGGHGLTGMRERLALVGGTLTAGSGNGKSTGWRVAAEVPE